MVLPSSWHRLAGHRHWPLAGSPLFCEMPRLSDSSLTGLEAVTLFLGGGVDGPSPSRVLCSLVRTRPQPPRVQASAAVPSPGVWGDRATPGTLYHIAAIFSGITVALAQGPLYIRPWSGLFGHTPPKTPKEPPFPPVDRGVRKYVSGWLIYAFAMRWCNLGCQRRWEKKHFIFLKKRMIHPPPMMRVSIDFGRKRRCILFFGAMQCLCCAKEIARLR